MVLGNSSAWGGDLQIAHSVMKDAIDTDAPRAALRELGLAPSGVVGVEDRKKIVAVLSKVRVK